MDATYLFTEYVVLMQGEKNKEFKNLEINQAFRRGNFLQRVTFRQR